jgi:hypothetical protein
MLSESDAMPRVGIALNDYINKFVTQFQVYNTLIFYLKQLCSWLYETLQFIVVFAKVIPTISASVMTYIALQDKVPKANIPG